MLSPSKYQSPARSWLLIGSVLAFIAVTAFSIFFEFKGTALKKSVDRLNHEKQIKMQEAPSSMITALHTDPSLTTLLENLEKKQLFWSKIIEKIENTIPKGKNKEPIVELRSYTGTEDRRLSMSFTTKTEAANPFADIASLIHAFSSEPSFQKVFVPSITKTVTPDGSTIFSFSMNFEYQKQIF